VALLVEGFERAINRNKLRERLETVFKTMGVIGGGHHHHHKAPTATHSRHHGIEAEGEPPSLYLS